MLTDYRHTHNHLRLVMVVVALCCKQTNEHTDKRTLPIPLSPCFAVDKYSYGGGYPNHSYINSDVETPYKVQEVNSAPE